MRPDLFAAVEQTGHCGEQLQGAEKLRDGIKGLFGFAADLPYFVWRN
jgi:hypothetical protein